MRMQVRSLALFSGLRIWCCSGFGRLAATAPIRPLAWELTYAAGVALKKKDPPPKKKTKKVQDVHFGQSDYYLIKQRKILLTLIMWIY